jgi:hypothetical protein
MINSARLRITAPLALLLGLAFSSCLFDKPKEEVQLSLTNVPAGVEKIRVVAVDRNDTSKILAALEEVAWTGQALRFPLGAAQGKDWIIRVEGYENDFLVYLTLIPSGEYASDTTRHVNVTPGWPAVWFTHVTRDSTSVRFTTDFRLVPSGVHWHLTPGAGADYIPSFTPDLSVALAKIKPGSLITADLHNADHSTLPVQLPDTMLADEALAPAGSTVRITDAFSSGDSVFLTLEYQNFRMPQKDEPTPGQGIPKVLDARGLSPLAGFNMVDGDSSRMAGPASSLDGVEKLVVALHYANNMRIRPPAADTVDAATALRLRVAAPSVKILSFAAQGAQLQVVLEKQNFTGLHVHISRDDLNSTDYQLCHTDTCSVDSPIWKGAKIVIVAAHRDEDHSLFRPLVADTLIPPP